MRVGSRATGASVYLRWRRHNGTLARDNGRRQPRNNGDLGVLVLCCAVLRGDECSLANAAGRCPAKRRTRGHAAGVPASSVRAACEQRRATHLAGGSRFQRKNPRRESETRVGSDGRACRGPGEEASGGAQWWADGHGGWAEADWTMQCDADGEQATRC